MQYIDIGGNSIQTLDDESCLLVMGTLRVASGGFQSQAKESIRSHYSGANGILQNIDLSIHIREAHVAVPEIQTNPLFYKLLNGSLSFDW
jgi:hypothetical protein